MITALYVLTDGHYFNLEGVDPWDEPRNALNYRGTDPVVAHPPCQRWCRLAAFVEKVYGYPKHEDGGTFVHALETVRRNGGVLEHPAFSDAWAFHGIARPPYQVDGCLPISMVAGRVMLNNVTTDTVRRKQHGSTPCAASCRNSSGGLVQHRPRGLDRVPADRTERSCACVRVSSE